MNKTPLTVAGVVFGLVALVHLSRLIFHFPLIIGMMVPYWANGIGVIIAAGLSFWMFYSAYKR